MVKMVVCLLGAIEEESVQGLLEGTTKGLRLQEGIRSRRIAKSKEERARNDSLNGVFIPFK